MKDPFVQKYKTKKKKSEGKQQQKKISLLLYCSFQLHILMCSQRPIHPPPLHPHLSSVLLYPHHHLYHHPFTSALLPSIPHTNLFLTAHLHIWESR